MPRFKFTPEELDIAERSNLLSDRARSVFVYFYRRQWRIEDIAAKLGWERHTICRDLEKIRAVIWSSDCHRNGT